MNSYLNKSSPNMCYMNLIDEYQSVSIIYVNLYNNRLHAIPSTSSYTNYSLKRLKCKIFNKSDKENFIFDKYFKVLI